MEGIMENKLVTHCPRCSNNLIATRLSCQECDLELNGDFRFNISKSMAKLIFK